MNRSTIMPKNVYLVANPFRNKVRTTTAYQTQYDLCYIEPGDMGGS